jgi:hypothetical protein
VRFGGVRTVPIERATANRCDAEQRCRYQNLG